MVYRVTMSKCWSDTPLKNILLNKYILSVLTIKWSCKANIHLMLVLKFCTVSNLNSKYLEILRRGIWYRVFHNKGFTYLHLTAQFQNVLTSVILWHSFYPKCVLVWVFSKTSLDVLHKTPCIFVIPSPNSPYACLAFQQKKIKNICKTKSQHGFLRWALCLYFPGLWFV